MQMKKFIDEMGDASKWFLLWCVAVASYSAFMAVPVALLTNYVFPIYWTEAMFAGPLTWCKAWALTAIALILFNAPLRKSA